MLRCAQHDRGPPCHAERSEASLPAGTSAFNHIQRLSVALLYLTMCPSHATLQASNDNPNIEQNQEPAT
jgi:hypothetical protein